MALLLGQVPQQAPLFHQLQQQVGDLQQEVVRCPTGTAGGMFQVQATVLLRVKSRVLRAPALPPSVGRHIDHSLAAHLQGRHGLLVANGQKTNAKAGVAAQERPSDKGPLCFPRPLPKSVTRSYGERITPPETSWRRIGAGEQTPHPLSSNATASQAGTCVDH
jgi:hypothetical protein